MSFRDVTVEVTIENDVYSLYIKYIEGETFRDVKSRTLARLRDVDKRADEGDLFDFYMLGEKVKPDRVMNPILRVLYLKKINL